MRSSPVQLHFKLKPSAPRCTSRFASNGACTSHRFDVAWSSFSREGTPLVSITARGVKRHSATISLAQGPAFISAPCVLVRTRAHTSTQRLTPAFLAVYALFQPHVHIKGSCVVHVHHSST